MAFFLKKFIIFFTIFNSLPGWAINRSRPKVHPNPFTITLIETTKPEFKGSEPITLHLKWNLAEGYHAYLEEFKIHAKSPQDASARLQDIRKVVEFDDKISGQRRQGVEGEGDMYIQVDMPPILSSQTLQGEIEITYQACATDHCLLPKHVPVHFTAKIVGAPPTLMGKQFNPKDWRIWLTVFVAGLLTSFTPCIFPLIPITLAILGARQEKISRRRGFTLSLFYVMGIAITYALMGLIAASTGALFGGFLGHPLVSVGLALFFAILGLGMLGLFSLETPAFLRDRLMKQKTSGGLISALVTGILAGLVASPCVGPVLAAILTYVAQTQNLILGFGLLFVFAMGLGLLFLLIGTFSSVQRLLPRSGPWMLAIKYIFAACFFALAIFYLQPWLKNIHFPGQSVQQEKANYPVLPWQSYNDEARSLAAKTARPVVIDFYADWCTACKELEKDTFSAPEVQALKDQFVFLKFDATKETPEFEKLRREFEIVGLPHLVFIDAKGKWQQDLTLTGYEKAPEFAERLNRLLKK